MVERKQVTVETRENADYAYQNNQQTRHCFLRYVFKRDIEQRHEQKQAKIRGKIPITTEGDRQKRV